MAQLVASSSGAKMLKDYVNFLTTACARIKMAIKITRIRRSATNTSIKKENLGSPHRKARQSSEGDTQSTKVLHFFPSLSYL
jgi:hypothetical protein